MLRLCTDLIALSIAQVIIVLAGERHLIGAPQFANHSISKIALAVSIVVVLYLFGAYKSGYTQSAERELERTVKGVSCAFLLYVLFSICILQRLPNYNATASYVFLITLCTVLCGRFGARNVIGLLWNSGYARRDVLFVGSSRAVRIFHQHLAILRYRGFHILGWIPIGLSDAKPHVDIPEIQSVEESCAILSNMKPQVVIVGGSGATEHRNQMIAFLETCRLRRIDVKLCFEFIDINMSEEIDNNSDGPFLRTVPVWSTFVQRAGKWILDRVFGLAGTLFTLLIAPIVWVLIQLEDPGPLFHRREFVDQDGSIRYYLKFRTMVRDADEIINNDPEMKRRFSENHKLRHDPRVLGVGRFLRKFSIDEFPQFFSVLTGQLSFVGPRVISEAEKVRYGKFLQKRLTVKPGLTGYWQVMGRQTTTYDERILMDMHYIDHWSIWLDLVIIMNTFSKFFTQNGAY